MIPTADAPQSRPSGGRIQGAGAAYEDARRGHLHGMEDDVAEQLSKIAALSGADEVLVTTSTYDRADMPGSYRRLARAVGLVA
ncbi:hypothetical protein ACH40E_14705 [Streptomyces acidicola]|uniref:hypothetical protein n=1 Tax=Streptomyces acidicola TaxID=2596892 RepID=UPI00379C3B77